MARHCPQCGGALPAEGFEGLCPRCVALCLDQFKNQDDSSFTEPPLAVGKSGIDGGRPGLVPSAMAVVTGQTVSDYELLEEIGRGGMGVVYRGRQLSLNRIVAVKTILSGPVASAEAVRRFHGEAEALARLKHPNIVSIYDVFERDGHHFFSMEYVPGNSLADLVREQPLPPAVAARYCQKVSRAIQFAHENGLLHRDLKPSNILIDNFDEPRVTDFGLAKRLNAEADLSYTGQLIGSPQYFAPEQISPKKGTVGSQTDVYSIGAVLYHLITGRPPFNAATLEEMLLKVIDAEPAVPRSIVARIPRDLETICLKCLEKEPARRYATAGELAEDLDRFLAFEPIKARRISAAERTWRWCARRRALVGAWVAAVLLPTALVLVLSQSRGPLPPGRTAAVPFTVAYIMNDRLLDNTNWTLKIANSAGASEVRARQVSGYTNPPFPICTNPVREMTYRLGPSASLLAFHFCSNATYDPAVRGEVKELAASVLAHQIDGAGNTRVAPCVDQDGSFYTFARPQAASPSDLAEIAYRGMTANDFSLPDGIGSQGARHPDFSHQGKPIRFGFAIRDTDPKRGHFGWVAVGGLSFTLFGPAPASFPFTDSAFNVQDWTVHPIADGSPVHWDEVRERAAGNPGKYMRLSVDLGDRTGLDLVHLCWKALYCPSIQGALESVDVSIDTRMTAQSSGRSANANLCPVIVQNGTVYGTGWRMATYTEQNSGWAALDFVGLSTNRFYPFPRFPGAQGRTTPLDFSTNGSPMRFGFATRYVTFHNNPEGHAFQTAIDLDNFVIKVHPEPRAF